MKNNYYINQYGVKTSKKLDTIIDKAWEYLNTQSLNKSRSYKMQTKKIYDLRIRFEKEVEKIGGVDYTFGDTLA
jgi:hypothetical protein